MQEDDEYSAKDMAEDLTDLLNTGKLIATFLLNG